MKILTFKGGKDILGPFEMAPCQNRDFFGPKMALAIARAI
jgi:hypothetical protein